MKKIQLLGPDSQSLKLGSWSSKRIHQMAEELSTQEGIPAQEALEQVTNKVLEAGLDRQNRMMNHQTFGYSPSTALAGLTASTSTTNTALAGLDLLTRGQLARAGAFQQAEMSAASVAEARYELERRTAKIMAEHDVTRTEAMSIVRAEEKAKTEKAATPQWDSREFARKIKEAERRPDVDPGLIAKAKQDADLFAKREKVDHDWLPYFKRLRSMKTLNRSGRTLLEIIGWYRYATVLLASEGASGVTAHSITSALSRSKVFHVDPEQAKELFSEIIAHTRRVIEIPENAPIGKEEEKALLPHTRQLVFPENLPYRDCFVGFGAGIEIAWEDGKKRVLAALAYNTSTTATSTAASTSAATIVAVFVSAERKPNVPMYEILGLYSTEEQWLDCGASLLQWASIALVDIIASHRTIVLQSPEINRDEGDDLKKLKRTLNLNTMPAAFYTVELRSKVYFHTLRRLKPVIAHRRKMEFQTDRRAHERVLVIRNPMPQTSEEKAEYKRMKKDLVKRKYTIYEESEPIGLDQERLDVRGVPPKQPGEWLAILTVDVSECRIGPEDAPYVPRVNVISTVNPTEVS